MTQSPSLTSINLTAMSIHDLAALLTKLGGETVTIEMLQEDLRDGAPANPDGSLNLVHYTAWIVKEVSLRVH